MRQAKSMNRALPSAVLHGLFHIAIKLWQLFVYDPNGVQLELTFEGSVEGDALPDMSPGRAYVAGNDFYDVSSYPKPRAAATVST
jgi:hypothetical protein